ncbi:transposase domain-containing protein [Pseudoroseomonas ludipueritiae]|uniref:transposase domain-containing protein n=1 Tax=Pseudoroseomonas ludipueritiae TaxID=198093 RepID=UPI001EEF755A|nr:transposase domain-containing protein [Pseudoroseomonas ludipueritiae]MCG7364520.1 transposase domain-containing protein [Roseomonas sp. ACRSG]
MGGYCLSGGNLQAQQRRPQRYFTDVLTRLVNGWPNSRIDELMLWFWAKADDKPSSAAASGLQAALTPKQPNRRRLLRGVHGYPARPGAWTTLKEHGHD